MKALFDFFPVILFFATFKLFGIFAATAVAIGATIAQIAWVKWKHGKVDTMLWISFAIIAVFGGATLLLHDETYIKWKPTVLYWVFACVLMFSQVLFKKNLMRSLLHENIALPAKVWSYVNLAWSLFFTVLGIINLYVAFHYSTDTWVDFKLFGATGMTLIFVLLQAIALSKYIEEEKERN